MKTLLTAAAALALSGAALAQTAAVTISSTAFVVKQVPDGQGKLKNTLAPPTSVIPGNALVFTLDYKNTGTKPATGFVINNPIPANVSFTGVEQPWAVVSVDGGKSFGPLATLKMPKGDGTMRAAVPQDVTAIRWVFAKPILPAAGGKVAFYAVVK
jgi:uncharacterized repeat protein (TIGR01451 family)